MWSFVMRCVRLYRPDRNPLRRRCDRIESAITIVIVLLGIAGVPFALVVGMRVADSTVVRVAAGRWVTAQLVADAPAGTEPAYGVPAHSTVSVRWRENDGRALTAPAPVRAGMKAGERARVLLDATGRPVALALDQVEVTLQAVMSGLAAFVIVTTTLVCMYGIARWLLDRRRAATWDEAWAAADARWHGPRR